MKQYIELLRLIRLNGTEKHPSRAESGATKNATIGLPNLHFHHDLQDGFPLLTTRKLNWKACEGELRSFLLGQTNNNDFKANSCGFWSPWARGNGDLGPVYGAQWNRFDQLQHVLTCLRARPTDRRMVVSAWMPDQMKDMVLPPCHLIWCVTPYDNELSLAWMQRSCDFPIGVPYNIASYALLTHILAKWAGMEVGSLDCIFCDSHIYLNQLQGVDEQLGREPVALPEMYVEFKDKDDFHSWTATLYGWKPEPNISFGQVEV